jgi:hypothetical protein
MQQYSIVVACKSPVVATAAHVCGGGRVPLCHPELPSLSGRQLTFGDLIAIHLKYRVPSRMEEHRAWRELSDDVALERAMLGQTPRGSKHSHQYRVSNAALREAARLAAKRWADFFEPASFEPIIATTREIQADVSGLGVMWGYDAAEKIAAHRGIVPEEYVYVQRGALVGARKLRLRVVRGRIRYADIPPKLRVLTAGDIEDFLCVNKDRLNVAMLGE